MRIAKKTTCICLLLLPLGFSGGCTTTSSSNTARTGTEQLLISNAVDQALSKVDFRPLVGKSVYLEEKYIDCVDKGYVIGSVRHRALRAGVRLVSKPEDADIVLELRSGAVGTDLADAYLGVPEVVLPGLVTLPEIRLLSRSRKTGTAKIAMVAYDVKTTEVVGTTEVAGGGGVSMALSDDSNWYVLGIGPYQSGSIRKEVKEAASSDKNDWQDPLPTQVTFRGDPGRATSPHRFAEKEAVAPQENATSTANLAEWLFIDAVTPGKD